MSYCENCNWMGIRKPATVRCKICNATLCDECKRVHAVAFDFAELIEEKNETDSSNR